MKLIKRATAARLLGLKPNTLASWAIKGNRGSKNKIPFYRIGRMVRYNEADVLEFLEDNRHD
jgi:excisionase family DNA binding protein